MVEYTFMFIIFSIIVGLLYIKAYSKVIDFCDNFIYSVIIMGIIEGLVVALLNSVISMF